jgi:hypothetical protein
MPQNFKVSFEYESLRSTETEIPGLRTIINIAFLAGAIVVGKRLYESVKKLMKASGQNPLDIDTKKI